MGSEDLAVPTLSPQQVPDTQMQCRREVEESAMDSTSLLTSLLLQHITVLRVSLGVIGKPVTLSLSLR